MKPNCSEVEDGMSAPASVKVNLDGVSKTYGNFQALAKTDLVIQRGEFLTLLGPSGSGKTTILNLIAGVVYPSEGRILIEGRDVTDIPPNKRELGMVFQNYALMPHLNVFDNVAFALRVRKRPRAEIRERVAQALQTVRLEGVEKRKLKELSGGQQQRVAIARCLIYNPSIILMDEPLGALDKRLREGMQLELKRLHQELNITILYVTHDQEEALTMSDRIVLINNGLIAQMGTPEDLYFRPRSTFVASFLGVSNLIDGTVQVMDGETAAIMTPFGTVRGSFRGAKAGIGDKVTAMARPESLHIFEEPPDPARYNSVRGEMVDHIAYGGVVKYFVKVADDIVLTVQMLTSADRVIPAPGTDLAVSWLASDTSIFKS